jgi:hypothetical protein
MTIVTLRPPWQAMAAEAHFWRDSTARSLFDLTARIA